MPTCAAGGPRRPALSVAQFPTGQVVPQVPVWQAGCAALQAQQDPDSMAGNNSSDSATERAEQAINRVLEAEREAGQKVAACETQAEC